MAVTSTRSADGAAEGREDRLRAREPVKAPRRVTILGSTGSVGCNALDLIERAPDAYRVEALVAFRNVEKLAKQARRVKARLAVIGDEALYPSLKELLQGSGVACASGMDAVVEAAERPADWVLGAIVGAAGLRPTLAAIEQGAIVALANKESLVCAGPLVAAAAERHGATILPVDSEHNAIFQVFDFEHSQSVERIVLTASGGPFRTWTTREMADVTPSQALRHPNWSMGNKITIDSATMMNKGLELIEAVRLFPVRPSQVEVLVHPQSVVHSLVGYVDGSMLAQLGAPDMRTPIAFALGWPDRAPGPAERLDLAGLGTLSFEAPDDKRFPALRLARQALQTGGGAPIILNAANEVAVEAFLAGTIGFLDIARTVEEALDGLAVNSIETLDDVFSTDREARQLTRSMLSRRSGAGSKTRVP